jgi:FtsH-binding integral membrane protein
MADYDNRALRGSATTVTGEVDAGLRAYMLRVYNYMLGGLALTGLVAYLTTATPLGALFFQQAFRADGSVALVPNILGLAAIFAPLAYLFFFYRLPRMSLAGAHTTFWSYAGIMGISFALILSAYTGVSAARVFFITAGTFGAMSLYGYTTKRDLTAFGSFLFMGLIGVILASLVNWFLASSALAFVISIIGVLVFTGLTAHDTQKIKESYDVHADGTAAGKAAIWGATTLYLDFVNLFLMLLRLFGDRR